MLQQVEENRYYVNGTPADCVRLAFATLKLDQAGWVLSGINAGEISVWIFTIQGLLLLLARRHFMVGRQ